MIDITTVIGALKKYRSDLHSPPGELHRDAAKPAEHVVAARRSAKGATAQREDQAISRARFRVCHSEQS